MSSKKLTISDKFSERLLLLMRALGFKKRQNTKFANKIGITNSFLSDVLNLNSGPSFGLLLGIADNYSGVNIRHLLTGEGEMFHKELKIGEGCIQESISIYNKVGNALDDDPTIAELMDMTRAVLKSDTDYSDSLAANVRSFFRALKSEKRLSDIERRLDQVEADRDKVPPGAAAAAIKKAI
jgi:transcriptional regulator with XRE-family HTH domain